MLEVISKTNWPRWYSHCRLFRGQPSPHRCLGHQTSQSRSPPTADIWNTVTPITEKCGYIIKTRLDLTGITVTNNPEQYLELYLWVSSPVRHCNLFQHGRACVGLPVPRNGRSPVKQWKTSTNESTCLQLESYNTSQQDLVIVNSFLCSWIVKLMGEAIVSSSVMMIAIHTYIMFVSEPFKDMLSCQGKQDEIRLGYSDPVLLVK